MERLPELTPDHRVVVELSELRLPTLSRGTTVAAYTNVTADHLDRHGTLEAYRAVKRRLAELVDPDGALVLNDDDPVVAIYGSATEARVIPYRRGEVPVGGLGVAHGWIVGDAIEPLADAAARGAEWFPAGASCRSTSWGARRPQHLQRHGRFGRRAAVRHLARGHPPRRRGVHRGGAPARAGLGLEGVRFINDSQGTQPDAVVAALRAFDGPVVLIAGGRDKGVDLTDLAAVAAQRAHAAVLIGESGVAMERLFRDAGLETTVRSSTLGRPSRRPTGWPGSHRGHERDRHGPAEPGRGQLRHVRGLRGSWPGLPGGGEAAVRRLIEERG